MNPDIRIHVDFIDNLKLDALISELGEIALRCLLRLWTITATTNIDGKLPSSEKRIAQIAGWEGDPKVFVETLIRTRWIDRVDGGLCLHEWAVHQPFVKDAKKRIESGRTGGKASAEARHLRDGTAQPNPSSRTTRSNDPFRTPNQTNPNQPNNLPVQEEATLTNKRVKTT